MCCFSFQTTCKNFLRHKVLKFFPNYLEWFCGWDNLSIFQEISFGRCSWTFDESENCLLTPLVLKIVFEDSGPKILKHKRVKGLCVLRVIFKSWWNRIFPPSNGVHPSSSFWFTNSSASLTKNFTTSRCHVACHLSSGIFPELAFIFFRRSLSFRCSSLTSWISFFANCTSPHPKSAILMISVPRKSEL